MNGPEHYREAQRLLSESSFTSGGPGGAPVTRDGSPMTESARDDLVARAQVHATLALTAATALPLPNGHVHRGWENVAGFKGGTVS